MLISEARPGLETPLMVILFGSGLIGSAILKHLVARPNTRAEHLPWDWSGATCDSEAAANESVGHFLRKYKNARLAIIWAAGRSGFGSDERVMETELAALQKVLRLAAGFGDGSSGRFERSFHMVSSAGGLFEGQRACTRNSRPSPMRAYGRGKLRQESVVIEEKDVGRRIIYRPSSVYGFEATGRINLISALVAGALMQKPIRITGSLQTLRDYILADDLGRFIVNRVLSPAEMPIEKHFLVSGRPASIFEVIKLVERRFRERLLIEIDPDPLNSQHITFSRSILPDGYVPTSLGEGIERVAIRIAKHRFAG